MVESVYLILLLHDQLYPDMRPLIIHYDKGVYRVLCDLQCGYINSPSKNGDTIANLWLFVYCKAIVIHTSLLYCLSPLYYVRCVSWTSHALRTFRFPRFLLNQLSYVTGTSKVFHQIPSPPKMVWLLQRVAGHYDSLIMICVWFVLGLNVDGHWWLIHKVKPSNGSRTWRSLE